MILSFADRETERIFRGIVSRKIPREIQRRALRKLDMIDAAVQRSDLEVPPGNRLKKLKGERNGWLSVRINRGWRVCFQWQDGNAYNVEINNHYGD